MQLASDPVFTVSGGVRNFAQTSWAYAQANGVSFSTNPGVNVDAPIDTTTVGTTSYTIRPIDLDRNPAKQAPFTVVFDITVTLPDPLQFNLVANAEVNFGASLTFEDLLSDATTGGTAARTYTVTDSNNNSILPAGTSEETFHAEAVETLATAGTTYIVTVSDPDPNVPDVTKQCAVVVRANDETFVAPRIVANGSDIHGSMTMSADGSVQCVVESLSRNVWYRYQVPNNANPFGAAFAWSDWKVVDFTTTTDIDAIALSPNGTRLVVMDEKKIGVATRLPNSDFTIGYQGMWTNLPTLQEVNNDAFGLFITDAAGTDASSIVGLFAFVETVVAGKFLRARGEFYLNSGIPTFDFSETPVEYAVDVNTTTPKGVMTPDGRYWVHVSKVLTTGVAECTVYDSHNDSSTTSTLSTTTTVIHIALAVSADASIIKVVVDNRLHTSTDKGASFSHVEVGTLSGTTFTDIAMSQDGQVVSLVGAKDTTGTGGVWNSYDGGTSFQELSTSGGFFFPNPGTLAGQRWRCQLVRSRQGLMQMVRGYSENQDQVVWFKAPQPPQVVVTDTALYLNEQNTKFEDLVQVQGGVEPVTVSIDDASSSATYALTDIVPTSVKSLTTYTVHVTDAWSQGVTPAPTFDVEVDPLRFKDTITLFVQPRELISNSRVIYRLRTGSLSTDPYAKANDLLSGADGTFTLNNLVTIDTMSMEENTTSLYIDGTVAAGTYSNVAVSVKDSSGGIFSGNITLVFQM
jgi:hypothetical protein